MASRSGKSGHMTQRRIAELANVSQATVSLVLNGKADSGGRIPPETRDRVLRVLQETGYVPDPAARRLAGHGNKILGVFTYEPAFPHQSHDFYGPLLRGIEVAAEQLACDLLLFASAPVIGGQRRLFHENNRLRLADGCLLLGLEMADDELARLVADGYPFVAVGRRDVEGVAYVGIDYKSGSAQLVERAWSLGHRRFVYLHVDSVGESVVDRFNGVASQVNTLSTPADEGELTCISLDGSDASRYLRCVRDARASVVIVETRSTANEVLALAREEGLSVPGDLSVIVLAGSDDDARDNEMTALDPPRVQIAEEATTLLAQLIHDSESVSDADRRRMIPCPIEDGHTLAAPGGAL